MACRLDTGMLCLLGIALSVSPPAVPQASATSAYSLDYVQKAYVAYYGRPADPGGQTYWADRMDAEGQSLNAIIGAFGNSDEFNRRYGGLTYPVLVTKIYQQALGRDPDPAGLAYYVGELEAGRRTLQSITLDVLNGATTAPDSTVVANKLAVAAYDTAKVAQGCAYGTEQDGVNTISGVTSSAATVTSAKAALDVRCASDLRKDAARFMRQATFGATLPAIDALVVQGYPAWLDAQFAMPPASHVAFEQADPNRYAIPWSAFMPSLWKQYIEGDDQLRARVAFALSQIFVVSITGNLSFCGGSAYLDVLNRNAFGNVRTLLKEVTLNATMGDYLSMRESAKADPVLQTQPDENYAREVMQLFSVGLVMLNLDGSVVLDGGGKPIPTFNEDTVKGFAKALSGWTFSGLDQSNPSRWLNPALGDADPVIKFQKTCPAESSPMEPWVADYRSADRQRVIVGPAHDTTAKQLLVYGGAPYSTLPAGQSAQTDLDNVIDNLFNHPNVGPFLAKQLIQRLVTSNPSPQYIARVASKFNNNGSGVRGDMQAVIRAILLDGEARTLAIAATPSFGKLTEPVVRFVQLHRAFNARRASGYYGLQGGFDAPLALNQSPLHAPSVFNFYHPDYIPAGPLAQAGLLGPEFEITNASSVAGFAEYSKFFIINGFGQTSSNKALWIQPDYTYYLGLAGTPTQMLDALDLVLCAGSMNPTVKAQIVAAIAKMTLGGNIPAQNFERLRAALWLIINSPDYLVQK